MGNSSRPEKPVRIAIAVLIVLIGAAGLVAATVQNAYVILAAPSATTTQSAAPSASSVLPLSNKDKQKLEARAASYAKKLIGKSEAVATSLAKANGFDVQVVRRDGKELVQPANLDFGRINLDINDNLVVAADVG